MPACTQIIPKFHYGSHYSSAGTVLYYMLRLEPFTSLAIALQARHPSPPARAHTHTQPHPHTHLHPQAHPPPHLRSQVTEEHFGPPVHERPKACARLIEPPST